MEVLSQAVGNSFYTVCCQCAKQDIAIIDALEIKMAVSAYAASVCAQQNQPTFAKPLRSSE
jgi:hypothetical protein